MEFCFVPDLFFSLFLDFLPEGFAPASQEQQVSVSLPHPSPWAPPPPLGEASFKKQTHRGKLPSLIYLLWVDRSEGAAHSVWMRRGSDGV